MGSGNRPVHSVSTGEFGAVLISLCGSSTRGTWWEDSYTEDTVRHVMEGSGNGIFLL
jgi:hypothetical protein